MSEAVTLEQIHEDILFLRREVEEVKEGVEDLKDIELEVKPEYLEKIKQIEKGKFLSRNELKKLLGE